jgi:hypothetical protein
MTKPIDPRLQHVATRRYRRTFRVGERVRAVTARRLKVIGTVACLPGERHDVPPHLYVIALDDGTTHHIHPLLLKPAS